MATAQTTSEELFESFCSCQGVPWEKMTCDVVRTADYRIELADVTVIAEVKQLDPTAADARISRELAEHGSASTILMPGRRVRREIANSREQLKNHAKGRHPALLVLYDNTGGRTGAIAPHDVLVAMYGEESIKYRILHSPAESAADSRMDVGGNRGVDRKQNTTLSAVGVMRGTSQGPYLDVFHNCYAARPIDPDWLRDGFVRHYAVAPWRDGVFRDWLLQ